MTCRLLSFVHNTLMLMTGLVLVTSAYSGDDGASLDCTIEPRKTALVGSFDEGILEEIAVERGDIVTRGQILASVESRIEKLTVDLTRLQAEQDVEIRSRQAQFEFHKIQTERAETLAEKDMTSSKELDDARVAERLAELDVESAMVRRRVAQVELALAEARLDRRTIRSPISGIVTEIKMAPGEYIHEQTPLLVLAVMDELNVEVFVPIARYGEITVKQTAVVEPIQPIGGRYTAVVDVVDQVFDAASGTFGVRLLLDNPDRSLPAGIRCKVRFIETAQDAQ